MTNKKPAILVIEDDHAILSVIVEILNTEGYEVYQATNGQIGFDILEKKKNLCLILVDLIMPVLDGFDFIKKINELKRSNLKIASIPVVVMTAMPVSKEMPVTKIIKKPINLDSFLNVVEGFCSN